MKLPKDVKTRHKIRDAKIILLYAQSKTMAEIGERFGISAQRVERIINSNKELLSIDRKYEKFKRINYLKRQLVDENGKEIPSKVDRSIIIEQLRKEFEGDEKINIMTQFFSIETPEGTKNRLSQTA